MTCFVVAFLLIPLVSKVGWAQQNRTDGDTRIPQPTPEQVKIPTSVKSGINSNFVDPDLNSDDWNVGFEFESREVYDRLKFPTQIKMSIHDALPDGERMILFDFERISKTSLEWTLRHVQTSIKTLLDEVQRGRF